MRRPLPALPRLSVLCAAGALLAGCASTYSLTLMPRDSGRLYFGEAVERSAGGTADVSVTIEGKTYSGNWIAATPGQTSGYVSAGVGFWGGRRGSVGGIGIGGPVVVDNPTGGESKALLQAADGSGLRCDFRGLGAGRTGAGTCLDDKGLLYDVQIRLKDRS